VIAAATENVHAALAPLTPEGVTLRVARPGELDGVEFAVLHLDDVLGDLAALRDLRVVQVLSAGTDWIETSVPPWAALCNARGARDVPVAEWVVGALLGAQSGLLAGARRSTWTYEPQGELSGSTVVILGHGSIGRAVERRLEPFGVDVVGVGRRQLSRLDELLPVSDAVVVLAPLTDASRGMVDAAFLARMRDGALLLNAGRGAVVDTDALVAELASGRLRAVLDVVDPEPLPDGHPLWELALAITPHHAGDSPAAEERAIALAAAQLGRYARGEPLENVVLPAGR
jgi:phosphoglycerate dehydrogenase-like enzyme